MLALQDILLRIELAPLCNNHAEIFIRFTTLQIFQMTLLSLVPSTRYYFTKSESTLIILFHSRQAFTTVHMKRSNNDVMKVHSYSQWAGWECVMVLHDIMVVTSSCVLWYVCILRLISWEILFEALPSHLKRKIGTLLPLKAYSRLLCSHLCNIALASLIFDKRTIAFIWNVFHDIIKPWSEPILHMVLDKICMQEKSVARSKDLFLFF